MTNSIIERNQTSNTSNIGKLLIEFGKITHEDTELILRKQAEEGVRFGEAAKKLGLITEADIKEVLARQFDFSYLTHATSDYSKDLVSAFQPFSTEAENFRQLRAQLQLKWFNEGFKAITITAPNRAVGCTYVAANLAISFAQLGKKTLLIDGNMRNPSIHAIFNTKAGLGLSDILAERKTDVAALCLITDLPNLTVLGAGTQPPNPQELLGRPMLAQLIKYVSSVYEVVIVDAPSYDDGSDYQFLSALTRGSVVVVEQDVTSVGAVRQLKKGLEESGATVIGSVFNKK